MLTWLYGTIIFVPCVILSCSWSSAVYIISPAAAVFVMSLLLLLLEKEDALTQPVVQVSWFVVVGVNRSFLLTLKLALIRIAALQAPTLSCSQAQMENTSYVTDEDTAIWLIMMVFPHNMILIFYILMKKKLFQWF